MKFKTAILLLLVHSACNDGEESFLWGEAASELAQDWCDVRERCLGGDEVDQCVRHNIHHLCELGQTCDVPSPEAHEVLTRCSASLHEIDGPQHPACATVNFGVVTAPCLDLLELMPGK